MNIFEVDFSFWQRKSICMQCVEFDGDVDSRDPTQPMRMFRKSKFKMFCLKNMHMIINTRVNIFLSLSSSVPTSYVNSFEKNDI